MLAIGTASRAEAAGQPSLDRRGVRRDKAVRGADLIVRFGVIGLRTQARFREGRRLGDGVVKRLGQRGIRRIALDIRPRLAEIIVHADRALLEEQCDPRVGRDHAVAGWVGRIGGNGFLEDGEGFGAIEVVAERDAFGPKRGGLGHRSLGGGGRVWPWRSGRVAARYLPGRAGHRQGDDGNADEPGGGWC